MRYSLGQKQRLFTRLVARLLLRAEFMGYDVTLGDAYRDPRVFGNLGDQRGYGRANSNHKLRLAIDLNLFKDGEYLTKTEDHEPLGRWWEQQHKYCRWGGHFDDGNHYELSLEESD